MKLIKKHEYYFCLLVSRNRLHFYDHIIKLIIFIFLLHFMTSRQVIFLWVSWQLIHHHGHPQARQNN